MRPQIHTQNLPEEQKKYLHADFLENEKDYWQMRDQLRKLYQGRWVAVHQRQVVATSDDLAEITDAVGKLGCHAYIAKVGEEDSLVFQVRRKEFAYDVTYRPFALPQAEVTFANYAQTRRKLLGGVIPDTGADLSVLPERDCLDIDLFTSPYFTTRTRGVIGPSITTLVYRGNAEIDGYSFPAFIQAIRGGQERLLGRDVLNRMRVTFDGPRNKVRFEPYRRR